MPRIAEIQLPNGDIAEIELPDQTLPEQLSGLTQQAAIPPTKIFDIPYVTRPLEQAGERVNRAVQGSIETGVEKGGNIPFLGQTVVPALGTVASLGAEAGKLTPSNLSLLMGSELLGGANALPISGKTGLPQLAEKAGGLVDTTLGLPTLKSKVRTGLKYFINKFTESIKPAPVEEINKTISPHLDKPVTDVSAPMNFIQELFYKRGIKIKGGTTTTETQFNNFRDAIAKGQLEPEDVQDIIEQSGSTLKGEVRKLRGDLGPGLTSKLKTVPLNKFKDFGKALGDLQNPDLTYGDLLDFKRNVGDLANFDSSERTNIERWFGQLYHHLDDSLSKTAKEGGFLKEHNFATEEGRKHFQTQFIKRVVENSRDFGAQGDQINFAKLSRELDIPDDEIKLRFGNRENYIKSIRDLTSEYAKDYGYSGIHGYINFKGIPHAYFDPFRYLKRYGTQSDIENIIERNFPDLGEIEKESMKNTLLHRSFLKPSVRPSLQSTLPQTGKLLTIPIENENR